MNAIYDRSINFRGLVLWWDNQFKIYAGLALDGDRESARYRNIYEKDTNLLALTEYHNTDSPVVRISRFFWKRERADLMCGINTRRWGKRAGDLQFICNDDTHKILCLPGRIKIKNKRKAEQWLPS